MEDVADGLNLSGLGLTPMWNDSKSAANEKNAKPAIDWGSNSGPITLAAPPRGARYIIFRPIRCYTHHSAHNIDRVLSRQ